MKFEMNIELMRIIDRWVGIPSCFLLSIMRRLASIAAPSRSKTKTVPPNRVLFIELSEVGSAILAYPAIQYIQRKYPKAEIYFLIFEHNRYVVDLLNVIPKSHIITISIQSVSAFIRTTLPALEKIRKSQIDTVFDLELFSRFTALLTGMSGATIRVGFYGYRLEGLYRGNFLTHPVIYNSYQHMAKNFLALVKSIEHGHERPLLKETITEPLIFPTYRPRASDVEAIMTRLAQANPDIIEAEHLIVFNPGAGKLLPIRAWPVENYIRLAHRILERYNAVLVLIGLVDASEQAAQIIRKVESDRCVNMVGRTNIFELLALLSRADLLVTADSGPAHFTNITQTACVVFFGPETPTLYAPLGPKTVSLFAALSCSPCLTAYNHRNTPCRDARCMQAITVEQVFKAVSKQLEK